MWYSFLLMSDPWFHGWSESSEEASCILSSKHTTQTVYCNMSQCINSKNLGLYVPKESTQQFEKKLIIFLVAANWGSQFCHHLHECEPCPDVHRFNWRPGQVLGHRVWGQHSHLQGPFTLSHSCQVLQRIR